MRCKPVTALPTDEKWTFEIKFDGYRRIAVKRGREVTCFSRHEKMFKKRFPGVTTALASLDGDFILDGELVAFRKGDLPFRFFKTTCLTPFRSISTASTC